MSGDVQPRKRKEKRRKREDEDAGTPPPTLIGPPEHGDNITIHVHKEGGTGGHWCAKIIFFTLFAALVGLVGVIVFEVRGTTDVDTPVASSKWAMIFEGWVEDSISLHEEEPHDEASHEAVSHEEEKDHEEAEESGQTGLEEEQEEEDEEAGSVEHGDEEDGSTEEEREEAEDEENQVESEDASEDNEGVDDEDDEDDGDEANDSGTLEEVDDEEVNGDNEEDNENEDDAEDSEEASEEFLNVSIEGVSPSTILSDDEEEDLSYEFRGIPGVNEIDDEDEPLEEIDDDLEMEELPTNDPVDLEPEKEEEEVEEESSVAVKFGVGVALVVAAHFVLVRRWSNADVDLAGYGKEVPDLTRRDTLISPPNVIPKVQAKESMEQASKVDKSKITNRPAKGPEPHITSIPKRKEVELDTSESELHSGSDDDENYEDSEGEEEEEEDEEEEEEEGEIVEIDDTELVAKLEAKYGKIPTPSQSENEDDEEFDEELDEEEEEEEDEEDESEEETQEGETEKHYDWKHVKAPKAHSGSGPTQHARRSPEPKGKQGKGATGGQQAVTSDNVTDFDEFLIQEELENWLMREFDN